MRLKNTLRHQYRRISTKALQEDTTMLYWALVFFIVAMVAGLFGFASISAAAVGIAKILFFVFLILFLVSLLAGIGRRGRIV